MTWTDEDLIVIRRLYGRYRAKVIGLILNKSANAVQIKASAMGLTRRTEVAA
jgi:hypothetical protein